MSLPTNRFGDTEFYRSRGNRKYKFDEEKNRKEKNVKFAKKHLTTLSTEKLEIESNIRQYKQMIFQLNARYEDIIEEINELVKLIEE